MTATIAGTVVPGTASTAITILRKSTRLREPRQKKNSRAVACLAGRQALPYTASSLEAHTSQFRFDQDPCTKQKGEPGGSPFCQFAESAVKRASSTYVSRATRTAKAVCSALVQL